VFTVDERQRVRESLLDMAHADGRVVAGAEVGSGFQGGGDRWSDLDLTFALRSGVSIGDVLTDWTADLHRRFGAVHLFDLPSQSSIYRVFLLPGCLQVDLSFTPEADFGARGPEFTLLFGSAMDMPFPQPPPVDHMFGLAVHHAVRARFSIERGRLWQAEYWITALRHEALSIACRQRGFGAGYGRGYDKLPQEILTRFEGALVQSLEREHLLRALGCGVDGLLAVVGDSDPRAGQLARDLLRLSGGDLDQA
jgi:hypothetical protein